MRKFRIFLLVLYFIFVSANLFSQTDNSISDDQEELELILKKCAEYCEKLSNSVLDFICNEKIKEEIHVPGDRLSQETETQETAWLTNLIDNDTIILLFSGNDFA